MDFYFDENLPPRVAKALDALEGEDGDRVFHTGDAYGKGILDPDLFQKVKNDNGILITSDFKMTTRKSEFALIKQLGLSCFFVALPSGCNFETIYKKVFADWELIKKISQKTPHPFLCKIKMRGEPEIF